MQDFDSKRYSKSVKMMMKERLGAAHCGGAGYGCARLQSAGGRMQPTCSYWHHETPSWTRTQA
jgi:hypothetical protein